MSDEVSALRQMLRDLCGAADDNEWHNSEDCLAEGWLNTCNLCKAIREAKNLLQESSDV